MRKTWIFFKLRMLQFRYDKTALLFSYIFPVLLLLGIGYANQSGSTLTVHYTNSFDTDPGAESERLLEKLAQFPLLELVPIGDKQPQVEALIKENKIKHYLTPDGSDGGERHYRIIHNSQADNAVENSAVDGYLQRALTGAGGQKLRTSYLASDQQASYLQILLPGLIGMTLLIIGLNGFGHVLIEEEHRGLFKNIKTISISPAPFLAGLFFSRLLISYSVAAVLFLVGVAVFDMSYQVNYVLLLLLVTLGSTTFLGLGLMLATLSPSVPAFTGMVNVVQLPFIVLGGVFFSAAAFPDWIQLIANAIPLTGLNLALQKTLSQPSTVGVAQLGSELVLMLIWCVVTLAISYRNFKW